MIDHSSLPPADDLETTMLKVARNVAMGLYKLEDILVLCNVTPSDFNKWKLHPRFQQYLKSEIEAWSSANNAGERTKVKAAIVLEDFMLETGALLADNKTPLNHRVELGKLLAKIAGMGEPKLLGGAGGGGFQLNISISQQPTQSITIQPDLGKLINHDEGEYDPFSSPDTLQDDD